MSLQASLLAAAQLSFTHERNRSGTKHLFQLFLLYSYIQVSPNCSSVQHYSCLGQIFSSCNPAWIHGFQTPFLPARESVCKLKVLLCPPSPQTHICIHIHGKWNKSKKFFLNSGSIIFFVSN